MGFAPSPSKSTTFVNYLQKVLLYKSYPSSALLSGHAQGHHSETRPRFELWTLYLDKRRCLIQIQCAFSTLNLRSVIETSGDGGMAAIKDGTTLGHMGATAPRGFGIFFFRFLILIIFYSVVC